MNERKRLPGTPEPMHRWEATDGVKLANEVKECANISTETKERLVREIAAYEVSHGHCTRTFSKKVRKKLRPPPQA